MFSRSVRPILARIAPADTKRLYAETRPQALAKIIQFTHNWQPSVVPIGCRDIVFRLVCALLLNLCGLRGRMRFILRSCTAAILLAWCVAALPAQTKRKVIIDQDCAGPGGTDMQAILALINSP